MKKKIKVAIVGTNGIPARYGGVETLAEHLTKYLSNEFDFTVYCSKDQPHHYEEYNGSKLVYIPIKANGWQSIFYDIYTLVDAALKADVILYLGPGAGYVLPFIRVFGKKIIVNHGGLNEWEREKYSKLEKFIVKLGIKYGAKYATCNVADNFLLRTSIQRTFGVDSKVIRYGGDHVSKIDVDKDLMDKYPFLKDSYFVNVSRAQIDNNLHLVLDTFKDTPEKKLVMVSNWSVSSYGINLKRVYKDKYPNIIILDAVYEPKEINAIRGNAHAYIHSHSYCGTAPSLVEAMFLGLPIFSFDVPTNRETTQEKAFFFKDNDELRKLIKSVTDEDLARNGQAMKEIADKEYTWLSISAQYADIIHE